jgi:hypothetical protein
VEALAPAGRVIAGQQIGIEAHVGRAARVGVVGEADELCAGNAPDPNVTSWQCRLAADLRAEDDDEILFAAQLVA